MPKKASKIWFPTRIQKMSKSYKIFQVRVKVTASQNGNQQDVTLRSVILHSVTTRNIHPNLIFSGKAKSLAQPNLTLPCLD
jgi:hypothetical protein